MTDLYKPRHTPLEKERITTGRNQLRITLSQAPYANNQSTSFAVSEHVTAETRDRRQYDVFTLHGVTDALHSSWRDLERHHGFIVAPDSTHVSVPITYYLSSYWLPFHVDSTLSFRLAVSIGVSFAALYIRWMLRAFFAQ